MPSADVGDYLIDSSPQDPSTCTPLKFSGLKQAELVEGWEVGTLWEGKP